MTLIKMSLAERDICVMRIEKQLEAKKQMLLTKQNNLNKNIQFNYLLERIKNDYQKYYNYIVQQKKDQLQAMYILNTYLTELTNNGELSEMNKKDALLEQKKILFEIKLLKDNMEDFVKQLEIASSSNEPNENINTEIYDKNI
jgi:hypothetical protein